MQVGEEGNMVLVTWYQCSQCPDTMHWLMILAQEPRQMEMTPGLTTD